MNFDPFELTILLLFTSVFIQTIEFFLIRSQFSNKNFLDWSFLSIDYKDQPKLKWVLNSLYQGQGTLAIIGLRALSLILYYFYMHPFVILTSFSLHLFTLLRFRGNFNGGSDFMTTQVYLGLTLGAFFGFRFGLWYVLIQLVNSYFVAGLIKVVKKSWRNGDALRAFFSAPTYALRPNLKIVQSSKFVAILFSWGVMGFELLFPFIFVAPKIGPFLLLTAFCFHLATWYTYGLNRFVFSWLAAYPSIWVLFNN